MKQTLTLLAAAAFLAAPALAQTTPEATVERDGSTLTITLPDGSVQAFEIGENTRLRVLDREERSARVHVLDRRPALRGLGDGAVEERRFVLRGRPGPDGEAVELRVDSLLATLPEMLEERFARLNVPRVWVEGPASQEARREVAEAERRSQRLALEARRAERDGDAAEAARLRAELRQSLEEAFDLRQQARLDQAERLREQRAALDERAREAEAEAAARQQNRRDIIDRRERALLGERGDLDW